MTVKEYLLQARIIKRDIERKQNQIVELRALAKRTTSTVESVRVSGTSNRSNLEVAVAKIVDTSEEINEDVKQYIAKYREISAVIDAVQNGKYRELLSSYYLDGLTWEEVAAKMHYSYVHVVHNLHPGALKSVKDLIVFNNESVI